MRFYSMFLIARHNKYFLLRIRSAVTDRKRLIAVDIDRLFGMAVINLKLLHRQLIPGYHRETSH